MSLAVAPITPMNRGLLKECNRFTLSRWQDFAVLTLNYNTRTHFKQVVLRCIWAQRSPLKYEK